MLHDPVDGSLENQVQRIFGVRRVSDGECAVFLLDIEFDFLTADQLAGFDELPGAIGDGDVGDIRLGVCKDSSGFPDKDNALGIGSDEAVCLWLVDELDFGIIPYHADLILSFAGRVHFDVHGGRACVAVHESAHAREG